MANYFTDRVVEHPGRIKLTDVTDGTTKSYDLERDEGNVSVVGTPFNATTFNGIAQDIIDLMPSEASEIEAKNGNGNRTTAQALFDSLFKLDWDGYKDGTPISNTEYELCKAIDDLDWEDDVIV